MDTILGRPDFLVAPVDELRTQLNRLIAVAPGVADAGRLNGAKMHLFVNDITPTKDTILTDFIEATFDGYAASGAIVWGPAFEGDDGRATIVGPGAQFMASAVPDPVETVYGYMILNGGGTALLFSERFVTPREFNSEGQALVVVPIYASPL